MAHWNIHIKGITPLKERYDDGEIEFTEMRDSVVRILRTKLTRYLDVDSALWDNEVYEAVEYLAETTSEEMFNDAQHDLYDWCDDNRVWLDPIE
jgi:hypothetical protein